MLRQKQDLALTAKVRGKSLTLIVGNPYNRIPIVPGP